MRASQNDSQGGYVEDPTTLAINLTYLGTLGLAVLMFLGLGLIIIITLVVAGIGRLISIILLAMVGIFPKKATTPIVHLPPRPARVPVPGSVPAGSGPADSQPSGESPLNGLAYEETGSTPAVGAPAAATVAASGDPAPKRDLLGDARRRLSGASAAVKDGAWKDKINPRKLPKPAQVKSALETQTAHHPLVVASAKEPPVLAKDWADAVAEADQRAAARAKAQKPPAIKVTVREVGGSTPSSNGKTPAPQTPDAPAAAPVGGSVQPGSAKPGDTKPGDTKKPVQGNGAKQGSNASKNGKTPSAIRKSSLSGASRNS